MVDSTATSGFVSHDSILLSHGAPTRRAFLLLHGLTASPRQFEAFGHLLFERGANVFIPRLPRHGLADRLTDELERLTAEELRDFASESAARAATLGRHLVVVGFSVGGLLSAWIGQHVAVERATAVSPFLGVAWIPPKLTGRAAHLALAMPNQFWWWDPIRRERQLPAHGYPRFATHAVAHAARLAHDLIVDAERTPPAARDVQIVLNANESTVSNGAARRLARAWSAAKGGAIVLHRLRGLPLSHDIIEPLRSRELVARVYPALVDVVDR
jgi:alpha-beta hydrolase superfamily lysophospholipase